jgi:hypothetical protein
MADVVASDLVASTFVYPRQTTRVLAFLEHHTAVHLARENRILQLTQNEKCDDGQQSRRNSILDFGRAMTRPS